MLQKGIQGIGHVSLKKERSVSMNIIGDVAGRFDELMLLLDKMPKDDTLLVGDIIDRGPKSKQVVDWCMNTPGVRVLKGNHEHMFIDYYYHLYDSQRVPEISCYSYDDFLSNGGYQTLDSYGGPDNIDPKHIGWMAGLDLSYKIPGIGGQTGLFVSHAPWRDTANLGKVEKEDVFTLLWNRYPPKRNSQYLQVFGHNGVLTKYEDYAICIDDSRNKNVCGLHWPSKEVFKQPYFPTLER